MDQPKQRLKYKKYRAQISTWELLVEVDKLMAHVPEWEPFGPNHKVKKIATFKGRSIGTQI